MRVWSRLREEDGAGAPSAGGSTAGGGHLAEGITPQDVMMDFAMGTESALRRVVRPKLDSGDIKFLKARKMQVRGVHGVCVGV